MIAAIIRWAIAHRGLVLLSCAGLCIAGLWALRSTAVDVIPDLSDVQVIVKTTYPGQAPRVVEDQVTYPLSSALLSVPKARSVRGYSFFGDSYIYVIFADGTDPYWARSRVLEQLSRASAQLPPAARPELGPDATGVGWIYEYSLIDRSGTHDIAALTSLQNWFLKFELQSLAGVAEVATVGGIVKQYQVSVDPERLRALNIPLSRVRSAILAGNQESGGGVIEMAEAEYMVRATGYISSREDLAAIPLLSTPDGVVLRLADVAEIKHGPEMRRGIAELNGEGEVVGGIVVMRQGENAQATIARVKQKLAALKASLPKEVELITTYDRSRLIGRSIATLQSSLLSELVIVSLICAAFLFHLRSALVTAITLPAGILVAFLIMKMQGLNANVMSLGGIAIAIGAMVDGSIVMIENLHKHLEREDGREHWQKVSDAAVEVGPALFFSLLIITLSFLPVFALQAQEGRLFAPLAFTKTYAMAAAAGLAITLVPVLMGYAVRKGVRPERANPLNRTLAAAYAPALDYALREPRRILAAALFLLLLSLWPASRLGTEFMPPLDEGDWMYMPTTRPGIAIGEARQLLQHTDKLIKSVPEVQSVFGKIGRAQTATDPAPLSMIETTILFKDPQQWRAGMDLEDIRAEIRERVQVPGLSNAWVMPIRTRIDMLATGIKTPLGIKISGPELSEIQAIGAELEALLSPLKGTASVYADRVMGGRYVTVDIDRAQAGRYGLNIADVQLIIQSAVGGMNIAHSVEGLERYPINLRYAQSWRDSIEALSGLPLVTASGIHLSLGDVAQLRIEDGPPMIKSENARPAGWVYVDVEGPDLDSYVRAAQELVGQQLQLPVGYALHWSGQYEFMQRAKKRLSLVLPVTLGIIVVLLYLAFGSLQQALLILLTVPMALIGGVWLVYLLDYQLSVALGVGFIALAGLAAELGVILFARLNQALAGVPNQADELRSAIREGAMARLRPIVMTASTVFAGLLPVMLADGSGADMMRRIAAPLVGGMISALFLSLLVLPAIYLLWRESGFARIRA